MRRGATLLCGIEVSQGCLFRVTTLYGGAAYPLPGPKDTAFAPVKVNVLRRF